MSDELKSKLQERKALAYDLSVEINRLTAILQQINGEIGKLDEEYKVATATTVTEMPTKSKDKKSD